MGGDLTARSRDGEGSSFMFSIPLRTTGHATGQSLEPALPRQAFNQRPVLLVEDNPVNQLVIQGMLKQTNILLDIADTGESALRMLCERPERYAAILMDIHLPDIDGLEVCRRYHAHCRAEGWMAAPCVALTASALDIDRRDCEAAGMQGFLSKPISRPALLGALAAWTETDSHHSS